MVWENLFNSQMLRFSHCWVLFLASRQFPSDAALTGQRYLYYISLTLSLKEIPKHGFNFLISVKEQIIKPIYFLMWLNVFGRMTVSRSTGYPVTALFTVKKIWSAGWSCELQSSWGTAALHPIGKGNKEQGLLV